jgi:hypothetical protein
MQNVFLTVGRNSETAELTGARNKVNQIQTLTEMGLTFHVGRDGWPRVPRSEIERAPRAIDFEPDFRAMR